MSTVPPGFDPGWWRRTMAEFHAISEGARLGDPAALYEELSGVRELLAGADLDDLVALAAAPLDIDNSEPMTAGVGTRRTPFTPFVLDRLVVPRVVYAAIREHASSVEPGHETVGRIIVGDDGTAIRYEALSNQADEPARFRVAASWKRVVGEHSILTHSHPGESTRPSAADLAYLRRIGANPFAIISDSRLAIYRLDGHTFARVPIQIQPLFRVDCEERLVLNAAGQIVPGGWDLLDKRLRRSGR